MANTKTRKKRKQVAPVSIIVFVLCACIVLYFVVSIVKKQIEINKNEDTHQELVSILESQQAENQELEAAISEGDESALAEEYARKKGYVMPDDRVYVDITPGEEQ